MFNPSILFLAQGGAATPDSTLINIVNKISSADTLTPLAVWGFSLTILGIIVPLANVISKQLEVQRQKKLEQLLDKEHEGPLTQSQQLLKDRMIRTRERTFSVNWLMILAVCFLAFSSIPLIMNALVEFFPRTKPCTSGLIVLFELIEPILLIGVFAGLTISLIIAFVHGVVFYRTTEFELDLEARLKETKNA